ncbi:hemerythrin domain-containing protein [Sulfurimonas sp. HSL-1656]|uniref:hemerythrin domain-containing protein n=1 Tax=Thiomicrolovo subterrani TaxID=3131934 RepID=UPI0031F8E58F
MMILEFLRDDHRKCDSAFADTESAVAKGDLATAREAFERFNSETLHHFAMEEEILFPAFEQRSGMQGGPTQVMRMEHEQVRGLLERMRTALDNGDSNGFLGMAESMMILLQQHNMKEEQMLYPACDHTLQGDASLVIDEMKAL